MIRLKGGRILDPASGTDAAGDLWISGGRIVPPPPGGAAAETFDLAGKLVMAGGIDIHTHIAGGNVNTARLLLPEWHKAHAPRPAATPLARLGWPTDETGLRYAEMGFTLGVEPAMAPSHALHGHLELADIPQIDKAGLVVLGNDGFLLSLLRDKESPAAIRDYVAHMVAATGTLGVKVINGGAAAAFKANVRSFNFEDEVPGYGVSSRAIVTALQRAVHELGLAHPLHVHCNNLGDPGNAATALATMAATGGLPIHFAHLQFYGYGTEGKRGFSSAAAMLAAEVNRRPYVTIDVGQVMFGETVTVSSDVMRQFTARDQARPRKFVIWDGESNGGGIVPYHYKPANFYNAVQWAVGLELFLLIEDPSRVFFTTDHPNGAPFTSYPELFALLMDRDLRAEWIARLPKSAMKMTGLPDISREYSLTDIATMTRAAPARLLGLKDRGHLAPGAIADVAVYTEGRDRRAMFAAADYVFKSGTLIVRGGQTVAQVKGTVLQAALAEDKAMVRRVSEHYDRVYGVGEDHFRVTPQAVGGSQSYEAVPCRD